MPMKYWRHSVRNKVDLRLSILLTAAFLLSCVTACQRAQLAEYRAYANDGDVPRISLEDAKKDYDSGFALFVDSRDPNSYAQEHIAGAINISAGSFDAENSKLPKDKKIIVYCS